MGWYWIVAGIVLIAVEIAAPSYFFLLTLGLVALFTGLLALTGVVQSLGYAVLVFCIVTAVSVWPLAVFAHRQRSAKARRSNADELIGQEAVVLEVQGKDSYLVDLKGEKWSARLEKGVASLGAGQRVSVKGIEGVHLIISKAQEES
ncbi:MAG: NfeD family protein [Elusimicrobia bacterium]|nr:NfeD family protein [Elusimicrobiota bacterium]